MFWALLFNKNSGSADKKLHQHIEKTFLKHKQKVRVYVCDENHSISDLVQTALKAGAHTIVAGGGDGTINAVVDVLLEYPKVRLGVLPLGTFNNFARTLGIPLDIDEALKVLLAGYLTHIDVGQVNGHAFVNNSGIGAYPALVRYREWQQEQGKSKKLAFFLAIIRTIFYCPFLRLDFMIEGHKLSRKTPVVFIGNNEYKLEGLEIGTRERLDKSALSLYITHASSHWQLFWLCCQVLLAGPNGVSKLDVLTTDSFTIHSRKKRLRVSIDGEVITLPTPLVYRVLPKALAVISI